MHIYTYIYIYTHITYISVKYFIITFTYCVFNYSVMQSYKTPKEMPYIFLKQFCNPV